MAWYNPRTWNKTNRVTGLAEQDNSGAWFQYFQQYASFINPDKLEVFKPENAYTLATNLAEIFIPIDAIADRVSSINFKLVNSQGEDYEAKGNLKRLIEQPNPIDRLNDLVYKSVLSDYAVGESFIYTAIPQRLVNPTIDNIANLWVLNPDCTTAKIYKQIANPFLIKDKSEIVEYYKTRFMYDHRIEPRYITHRAIMGLDSDFKAISPLVKATRNINNLLAVYQARYNVYAKNGNGGILSRDAKNLGDLEAQVDPVTRDAIIKDLAQRNGITGGKNFMGISSIPLKFIKTLGTIAELEPFKETETDLITIASIMGVDKYLLPISESTTFTNKQDAEKGLWQNVIKGVGEDKAKDLTKAFALPDGIRFEADFSHIEVLQEDKKTAYESDGLLIDNLDKLREAGNDVQQAYNNLTEKYNG